MRGAAWLMRARISVGSRPTAEDQLDPIIASVAVDMAMDFYAIRRNGFGEGYAYPKTLYPLHASQSRRMMLTMADSGSAVKGEHAGKHPGMVNCCPSAQWDRQFIPL